MFSVNISLQELWHVNPRQYTLTNYKGWEW